MFFCFRTAWLGGLNHTCGNYFRVYKRHREEQNRPVAVLIWAEKKEGSGRSVEKNSWEGRNPSWQVHCGGRAGGEAFVSRGGGL